MPRLIARPANEIDIDLFNPFGFASFFKESQYSGFSLNILNTFP